MTRATAGGRPVPVPWAVAAAALVAALGGPGAARAADAGAAAAVSTGLPALELTAARVDDRSPDGAQALYDAARDLDERLRAAAPVSARCAPLHAAARRHALARVRQAEAMDRPAPTSSAPARRRAAGTLAAVRRIGPAACRGPGGGRRTAWTMSPGPDEATFGTVAARVPPTASRAEILVDGAPAGVVAVRRGGRVRAPLDAPAGVHRLELRARTASGRTVARLVSDRVVLLPARGRAHRAMTRRDPAAAARLTALGARFPGDAALWIGDLATGRYAAANADAPFPAASLVKLGLLVAVLARPGDPLRAPWRYDAAQVARWSGNLAANRLLRVAGDGSAERGAARAAAALARMGASSSTYPGPYIAGTALGAPPRVSARVTTARDMARVLAVIHAAAAGDGAARRATGLTTGRARLLVGLLAGSEQTGDNRSLVRGALSPGAVVAEKNGWLRAARHGAAVIHTPAGPRVVVVLTHSSGGVPAARARALGGAAAAVALGLG